MTNDELTALVAKLQAQIDQLLGLAGQRTVEQNLAPLDINSVHVPYVFRAYPRTLYKPQAEPRVGQIDHPGFDSVIARTVEQEAVFIEQGWLVSLSEAMAAARVLEAERSALADIEAPKTAKRGK